MRVLLSHPFSGALYAYFAEFNENKTRSPQSKDPHPYYRTLYGDAFPQHQDIALTLAMLFQEIVIVPADAYLPGYKRHKSGDQYKNMDIGLYTEWNSEIRRQLDDEIERDMKDVEIQRVLRRVPDPAKRQILLDSRHEIHLAQKYTCPIVCARGRRQIIERLLQVTPTSAQTYSLSSILIADEYVCMTGPIFESMDLDTLISLKNDRELRSYSDSFVTAMEGVKDVETNPRIALLGAMKRAIASAKFSKHISGVFQGTSTTLNVAGLIPVLGTAASVGSIAADFGANVMKKREDSQCWYELSGQIKRIASIKEIEREIDNELRFLESEF